MWNREPPRGATEADEVGQWASLTAKKEARPLSSLGEPRKVHEALRCRYMVRELEGSDVALGPDLAISPLVTEIPGPTLLLLLPLLFSLSLLPPTVLLSAFPGHLGWPRAPQRLLACLGVTTWSEALPTGHVGMVLGHQQVMPWVKELSEWGWRVPSRSLAVWSSRTGSEPAILGDELTAC